MANNDGTNGNLFKRAGKPVILLLGRATKAWIQDEAPRLSAALAFFAMLSLSPLLLVASSIAGFFYEDKLAQQQLIDRAYQMMGPEGAEIVQKALENADFDIGQSIFTTVVSLGIILFASTAAFAQLQSALNEVWDIRSGDQKRSVWKTTLLNRGLSLAMVIVLGLLVTLSPLIGAGLTIVEKNFVSAWPALGLLAFLVEVLVGLGVLSFLFAMIFLYLPNTKVDVGAAWIGGFTTAALLAIGNHGISLYLGHTFVTSVYGAAGSLVVFLLWVYAAMMIFFFGAEVTRQLSDYRLKADDGGNADAGESEQTKPTADETGGR